jgi:hypothetical protein
VLVFIQTVKGPGGEEKQPDGKGWPVTLEAVEKHFNMPVKGFIQKLIEVKHLEVCDAPVPAKADGEQAAAT